MGRTLVVQAFLLVTLCLGLSGARFSQALAGDTGVIPISAASADPADELASWLDQLCFVVHCTAERSATSDSLSRADFFAVKFILSYEAYGVRQDLTDSERRYAQAVTLRSLRILAENPGALDSAVEDSLSDALSSLQIEIQK